MQSIITRYRGPTANGAAKIIAKTTSGIWRAYSLDHERTDDQQHKFSAINLAKELGWHGHFIGGAYNDKGAMVWVHQSGDEAAHFIA